MIAGARWVPSEWLLYCVLALVPLPFGSVGAIWITIWCAMAAVSLATADTRGLGLRQLAWLIPPLVAYVSLLGVVAVQQLPLFPGYASDRFWSIAQDAGSDAQALNAATLDPGWRALGPSLLFVLIFARTFLLAASRDKAYKLFAVAKLSGAAYACFGFFSIAFEPGMVLGHIKQAYIESVTGTFVNRNTAATYFGSVSVLYLLGLLRAVRKIHGGQASISAVYHSMLHSGIPWPIKVESLGLVICFAATLATNSRAGTGLTLVALALALALWSSPMSLRRWVLVGCCALICLAGVLEVFGGSLLGRLQSRGIGGGGRVEIYFAVLRMIGDFPWFGVGLGQFEFVFPAYRASTAAAAVWDKAHSVPLELAAELGLPVTSVIALAWATSGFGLFRGYRHVITGRTFPIAGLSVGFLATGHACVDFSLQIPGYATLFAALLGASLSQSVNLQRPFEGSKEKPKNIPAV